MIQHKNICLSKFIEGRYVKAPWKWSKGFMSGKCHCLKKKKKKKKCVCATCRKLPMKTLLCGCVQPAGRDSQYCPGTAECQAGRGRAAMGQRGLAAPGLRGDRGAMSPWSSNLPPGGRRGGDLSWVESSACLSRAFCCSCYIAVILTHWLPVDPGTMPSCNGRPHTKALCQGPAASLWLAMNIKQLCVCVCVLRLFVS